MTYSPIQLEVIRVFGKKDLTFGCIVCADKGVTHKLPLIGTSCIIGVTSDEGEIDSITTYLKPYKDHEGSTYDDSLEGFMSTYTILGHEPHLEDVFMVAKNKGIDMSLELEYDGTHEIYISWGDGDGDTTIPYNPTLPLLEQSEETLTQLCNLFK